MLNSPAFEQTDDSGAMDVQASPAARIRPRAGGRTIRRPSGVMQRNLDTAHIVDIMRRNGIRCRKNCKKPTVEAMRELVQLLSIGVTPDADWAELEQAILAAQPRTPEATTTSTSTTAEECNDSPNPTVLIDNDVCRTEHIKDLAQELFSPPLHTQDEAATSLEDEIANLDPSSSTALQDPEQTTYTQVVASYPTEARARAALMCLEPAHSVNGSIDDLHRSISKRIDEALTDGSVALRLLTNGNHKESPPPITFYKEHFNYVDRVDLLMSFLNPGYRTDSASLLWLQHLVRLSVVQLYTTEAEGNWSFEGIDINQYHTNAKYRVGLESEQRKSVANKCKSLKTALGLVPGAEDENQATTV